MADSPGSPLSSHASSEFTEDIKTEDREQSLDGLTEHDDRHLMPTTKRQKLGTTSYRSTPQSLPDVQHEDTEISSDTSGDVPTSPATGQAYTQDDDHLEQITVCKWRNCPLGDLGNMDALVDHVHMDHIGQRQKRYACEWEGCSRIDANHASGYALRAHMRSHTREKPFYCALPECDRSFTRSDALAKHMRTVHETEALRPSDPVPRSHSQAQVKPQRLKLIVNAKSANRVGNNGDIHKVDEASTVHPSTQPDQEAQPVAQFEYPPELQFTEDELSLPPDQLFKLFRRQVHWAEEENQELKDEIEALEAKRKEEWQAKELILANLMEAELATAHEASMDFEKIIRLKDEMLPQRVLPMVGQTPWYRFPQG
ncbi:hypothetical protein MMC34_008074 [Xylographa carneopallida]|nr:hypothetical protein [Xylographa carneopallida]